MDNELFNMPLNDDKFNQIVENKQKSINCCSLYRECSLEKKCVNPNEKINQDCLYKNNLQSGNIFYSKQASNFSDEKYQDLLIQYNKLCFEQKRFFNNLLYYIIFHKNYPNGALFVRVLKLKEFAEIGLLIDDKTRLAENLELFSNKYIKELITDKKDCMKFIKAKKEEHRELYKDGEKEIPFKEKKAIMSYIVSKDQMAADKFYSKYFCAKFEANMFLYYRELYEDRKIQYDISPRNYAEFFSEISLKKQDLVSEVEEWI